MNKTGKARASNRKKLLATLAAMSPEQGFQTLVDAGIYTKSGKLSKNYGG